MCRMFPWRQIGTPLSGGGVYQTPVPVGQWTAIRPKNTRRAYALDGDVRYRKPLLAPLEGLEISSETK